MSPVMQRFGIVALLAALLFAPSPSPASPMALPVSPVPWLGISIKDVRGGVFVDEVIRGTPAEAAGLEVGDIVVAIGDKPVSTTNDLQTTVQSHPIGEEVSVTYYRYGTRQDTRTSLTAMPDDGELLYRRLVDEAAPGIELASVQSGQRVRLSDLRGQVVVLAFVSTATRAAVPIVGPLVQLAAARRGELTVLGISGDSEASMRTFAGRYGVTFPLLYDFSGAHSRMYRIDHPPALVVIDRDGVIRYAGYGADDNVDDAIFAAKRALRRTRGALRDLY